MSLPCLIPDTLLPSRYNVLYGVLYTSATERNTQRKIGNINACTTLIYIISVLQLAVRDIVVPRTYAITLGHHYLFA